MIVLVFVMSIMFVGIPLLLTVGYFVYAVISSFIAGVRRGQQSRDDYKY